MSNKDSKKNRSPTPAFVIGIPDNEPYGVARARLFEHHLRSGTMGMYYEMFPMDRPVTREPRKKERGRD